MIGWLLTKHKKEASTNRPIEKFNTFAAQYQSKPQTIMKFPRKAWESFKQTPSYQSSLDEFTRLGNPTTLSDITDVILKHCPDYSKNLPIVDLTSFFIELLIEEQKKFETINNCVEFFADLFDNELTEDDGTLYVKEGDSKFWVNSVPVISVVLYNMCPDFYIPYLFPLRFRLFRRILSSLELTIPDIPIRSDYFNRYMYYIEFCDILFCFKKEAGLTTEELCVFLYEFMPNHYLEDEDKRPMPEGMQAWFIGGKKRGTEVTDDFTFWQANEETLEGDILVFYETSPVCAITGIWRAKTDGICDPFFGYYSHTYIGDEIRLAHPVTKDELKADEVMKTNGLIRKNFQGVNGWPLTTDEYNHIIDMIAKNENADAFPRIYSPGMPKVDIKLERDVSNQLLVELFKKIGITNYSAEFETHVGRASSVRPDFVIDVEYPDNERPTARVTCEVKKRMKNNREILANYNQGESYARALKSKVLVICDERIIQVHTLKDGSFSYENYVRFCWDEAFGKRFAEIAKLLI